MATEDARYKQMILNHLKSSVKRQRYFKSRDIAKDIKLPTFVVGRLMGIMKKQAPEELGGLKISYWGMGNNNITWQVDLMEMV